ASAAPRSGEPAEATGADRRRLPGRRHRQTPTEAPSGADTDRDADRRRHRQKRRQTRASGTSTPADTDRDVDRRATPAEAPTDGGKGRLRGQSPAAAADPRGLDRGEREELLACRADLDLGIHAGADAAVVARGPAAVVDLDLVEGVLPVLPEPVAVEAGVEVVPGEHLGVVALADGVPLRAHRCVRELGLAGGDPAVVGEVLAPTVEATALGPHPPDHRADAPVAAGEQALDRGRLAVVVPEADRLGVLPVRADVVAQLAQPLVDDLPVLLRRPLERGVRLRHERADGHRAADVAAATRL